MKVEFEAIVLEEHEVWALENAWRVMSGDIERRDLACWPEHCDALESVLGKVLKARKPDART